MSRRASKLSTPEAVFAALGDATRLSLVEHLAAGRPASIAELTAGTRITRQAVTKHLSVLERAGLVRGVRCGRENRFGLDPRPLGDLQAYLGRVSQEWNDALSRLKAMVEEQAP
jgi:DNA-binding transcriptional ArsR family regulator